MEKKKPGGNPWRWMLIRIIYSFTYYCRVVSLSDVIMTGHRWHAWNSGRVFLHPLFIYYLFPSLSSLPLPSFPFGPLIYRSNLTGSGLGVGLGFGARRCVCALVWLTPALLRRRANATGRGGGEVEEDDNARMIPAKTLKTLMTLMTRGGRDPEDSYDALTPIVCYC